MDQNPMWNAILKWSLQQHDPEPSKDIKPMSQEDKEFLDRAFRSMVVDETERMKIISAIIAMPDDTSELVRLAQSGDANPNALFGQFDDVVHGTLANAKKAAAEKKGDAKTAAPSTTTPAASSPATPATATSTPAEIDGKALAALVLAKKETALDELEDRVLKIDNATDLHKVGGLIPLIKTINSPYPSLRWRAANVLGTVVQNNPTAQQWALDHNAMQVLLSSIQATSAEISLPSHHPELPKVLAKLMFALSCLIRQHAPSEEVFLKSAGITRLIKLLSNEAAPADVRRKCLTLLHYFFVADRSHRLTARTLGVIPVLVGLIGHDDIDIREKAPRALWALCSKEQLPLVANQLARTNLTNILSNRIAAINALTGDDREAAERERKACARLLAWIQTLPAAVAPPPASSPAAPAKH